MNPLYIFDIDGTLSLPAPARLAYLANLDDPDRWDKFYDACSTDEPNTPVLRVLNSLYCSGFELWFWTGRSERVREQTAAWLHHYTPLMMNEILYGLLMRPHGCYTADFRLKEEWLTNMLVDDRNRLGGVFEDRAQVVSMWRASGVPCFHVAEGDF